MAEFTANPQRFDPYKNFRFTVVADGKTVLGISKVSALKRTTQVVKHRSGGDPLVARRSPGPVEYEPITLERGVTHDKVFEQWANRVFAITRQGGTSEVSLANFRKDITVYLHNEAGQRVIGLHVHRAWPSEYVILGDLDSNQQGVAISHIKLEHEGWEWDQSVSEPAEPHFTTPA